MWYGVLTCPCHLHIHYGYFDVIVPKAEPGGTVVPQVFLIVSVGVSHPFTMSKR